jgi:hypothetical protein
MKKWSPGLVIIFVVVGLLLLVLNPVGCAVLWVLCTGAHIHSVEKRLQQPDVYRPVAEALAEYCQTDPALVPDYLGYAWMPPALDGIGNPRVHVSTNGAGVEFGGGFHHFGYMLDRVPGGDGASNTWALSMYSETHRGKTLTEVILPASRQLSKGEVVSRVTAGFRRRLASSPRDDDAFKGMAMFLLHSGETSAAQGACEEWCKARPDYWMPHSTLAHVRYRLGEGGAADRDFSGWVAAHSNFPNFIYLFLFEMREGRDSAAIAAIRHALAQPFVEPLDSDGNKFYLGHNAAVFAFMQRDYDLALALCDRMLRDSRQEACWQRKTLKLRAGSLLMKGDAAGALAAMEESERHAEKGGWGPSPEDARRHELLLNAIRGGDRSFVADHGKWGDRLDSWFTPFDVDETAIHGRSDLSAPYPANWVERAPDPAP